MRTLEITDRQAVLIVENNGNVSFLPAKGEEAQVTNAATKALALVLQDPRRSSPLSSGSRRDYEGVWILTKSHK